MRLQLADDDPNELVVLIKSLIRIVSGNHVQMVVDDTP